MKIGFEKLVEIITNKFYSDSMASNKILLKKYKLEFLR